MNKKSELIQKSEAEFKKLLDREIDLINSTISAHGVDFMVEDKALDIFSALLFSRIKPIFENFLKDEEYKRKYHNTGKTGSSSGILSKILSIFTVLSVLIFIYSLFMGANSDSGSRDGELTSIKQSVSKIDVSKIRDCIFVGPFEFKKGHTFAFDSYAGKKQIIKDIKRLILGLNHQIKMVDKKELDKMNAFNKQNFLLTGPPGTGKTIFVRYIITQIDKELKLNHLKETDPAQYQSIKNDQKKVKDYLDSADSRILLCEVTPSAVNSKYVGESEKAIGILYEAADHFSNRNNFAVFIFFDEGDVFFEKRDSGSTSNQSAGNIKSELLQRIGVMPRNKYYPVYTFCSTNRRHAFDAAFERRFGTQWEFGIPELNERKSFIEFSFKDFNISQKHIDIIANLTQGRPQSYIASQMKDFYIEDDNLMCIGFKLKEYIEHLNANKNAKRPSYR